METILSQIEGSAKPTIDLLLDSGPTALSPLDALGFAQFLAFQVTRGRACRPQIVTMANAGMLKLWERISDKGIATRLKQQGGRPQPGGRRWHPEDVGRVDGREVDDGSSAGRARTVCRLGGGAARHDVPCSSLADLRVGAADDHL
jgi:hypothetical protein